MKLMSRAEEIILLTILKLEGGAYGVAIRDKITDETGSEWSFAAIYTPLNKLTRKRFVTKKNGPPTNERGGRRKCMYQLTDKGMDALREIKRVQDNVWAGASHLLIEGGPKI